MSRRLARALLLVIAAAALIAVGVIGGVVWGERRGAKPRPETAAAPVTPARAIAPATTAGGSEPVEVTLTPEAVQRAGIKTDVVRQQATAASVAVPGTVTPNAYRETKASALVGGIVRSVAVELGSSVSRGQPLAVIFSTELADAQMKYLSGQAMLVADHQKRERTEKLLAIGAASRQELEEITAVHTAHETEVAAARQRLLLLGLSPQRVAALRSAADIVSELAVPAPSNGVVIARSANPGQVVSAGAELFAVADLSSVWVIGDLYEKDFATVRVGSEATVSVPSASQPVRGRVAYIDPRVDPATRTAKVRVEVPSPGGALRLGMFVTVSFGAPSAIATVIPRTAVQSVGDRSVVYVAATGDEPRFIERQVTLGAPVGDVVQVLSGLKPGERIVTEGSFFVRAEAARSRAGG